MSLEPELAELIGRIDFDPEALHARYLAERDRRLREDGASQYVEVKAEFSHYIDDPYVEPGFSRAPVTDEVEFTVIGGGFGGLLMGARLREAGYQSLRMIEGAGEACEGSAHGHARMSISGCYIISSQVANGFYELPAPSVMVDATRSRRAKYRA